MNLQDVMTSAVDGRTIEGGRWALRRMQCRKQRDGGVELGLFHNYMTIVAAAERLCGPCIDTLSDNDLKATLALLRKEEVALPPVVQSALLKRRVDRLVLAEDFEQVCKVGNPFVSGLTFKDSDPIVSSLSVPLLKRMLRFQRIVFFESLPKLIEAGEESADKALVLLKGATGIVDQVDLIDLGQSEGQMVASWTVVLNALIGVLTTTLDLTYEDPHVALGRIYPRSLPNLGVCVLIVVAPCHAAPMLLLRINALVLGDSHTW